MAIVIKHCEETPFIKLAKEIGGSTPPRPLRRVLSLMRLVGCKTIVIEESIWPQGCNKKSCDLRFNSCKAYIKNLPKYNYTRLSTKPK